MHLDFVPRKLDLSHERCKYFLTRRFDMNGFRPWPCVQNLTKDSDWPIRGFLPTVGIISDFLPIREVSCLFSPTLSYKLMAHLGHCNPCVSHRAKQLYVCLFHGLGKLPGASYDTCRLFEPARRHPLPTERIRRDPRLQSV